MDTHDYTVEFLRAISDRLSGRKNCRKIEYTVCIGMDDDSVDRQLHLSDTEDMSNKVYFYPERVVYPDRFHRQKSDLTEIVYHILKTRFKDTVYDCDQFDRPCFKQGSLTPGIYKYILSFDKRRRQWVRVK